MAFAYATLPTNTLYIKKEPSGIMPNLVISFRIILVNINKSK